MKALRPFRRVLMALVVSSLSLACGSAAEPATPVALESTPEKQALIDAKETTTLRGSNTFAIQADVWLNAMPGASSPGIQVSAKIAATHGSFSDGLSLGRIYVVHGSEVWSTSPDEVRFSDNRSKEGVSRAGPSWAGGTSTDVVVRIDDTDGASSYLAARNVKILVAE